jgi:hypothetical protein
MMLDALVGHAAEPLVAPGLWEITIVDFADRTSVVQECVNTSDWSWWIVYAGKTANDESCAPPVAIVENNTIAITQACKSVSAEMTITQLDEGKLSGYLLTSSLTPYGIAIPFHSTFEAQRVAACP